MRKENCSRCDHPLEPERWWKYRYCKPCHAAYARENRAKHSELPEDARIKANARAYSRMLEKRGQIQREPCWCGKIAQRHHIDYKNPRLIGWLCEEHHRLLHEFENEEKFKSVINKHLGVKHITA